jgi:hypothetical protein
MLEESKLSKDEPETSSICANCDVCLPDKVSLCQAKTFWPIVANSGYWLRQQFARHHKTLISGLSLLGCGYRRYNNNADDLAAMDHFYLLGTDGSGYSAIPDTCDFIILHHVVEHARVSTDPDYHLHKLTPGGYIWTAFPPYAACLYPRLKEHFNFATIPRM